MTELEMMRKVQQYLEHWWGLLDPTLQQEFRSAVAARVKELEAGEVYEPLPTTSTDDTADHDSRIAALEQELPTVWQRLGLLERQQNEASQDRARLHEQMNIQRCDFEKQIKSLQIKLDDSATRELGLRETLNGVQDDFEKHHHHEPDTGLCYW